MIGVNIPEPHSISPVTSFAMKSLQRTPMVTVALATYRKIREMRRALFQYHEHPLAWYGIVPKELFARFYTGKEHVNSFLALETLQRALPNIRGDSSVDSNF
jgi:hypothetical protein